MCNKTDKKPTENKNRKCRYAPFLFHKTHTFELRQLKTWILCEPEQLRRRWIYSAFIMRLFMFVRLPDVRIIVSFKCARLAQQTRQATVVFIWRHFVCAHPWEVLLDNSFYLFIYSLYFIRDILLLIKRFKTDSNSGALFHLFHDFMSACFKKFIWINFSSLRK